MGGASEIRLPDLGVGITYSPAIEPLLEEYPGLVHVVEVEPQTTWIERRETPERYRVADDVLEHIARLPGRKLVHSVGVPVGGTLHPEAAQVSLLQRTIARLDAPWASEHLSFNSTPEFRTGFFLPARQTWAGIEAATASTRELQKALPVPLAIETGVNYLQRRADELPDGVFVAAVLQAADCGLLLDLHNVFTNACNGRQSVEEFLAQIPLDRVWEIHLAGGFEMEGYWLDAHSGAIPEPLFQIAKQVVPLLPNLKAIIFEIFPSFVPVIGFDTIRVEIEKLQELWQLRGMAGAHPTPIPSTGQSHAAGHDGECSDSLSPEAWEQTLGRLVIGQQPDDTDVAHELTRDPGVGVVSRLISEFRASMVVSILRLTSRLLMLTLGADVFRTILQDFWSKTPPQHYASSEAESFAAYLEDIDLQVPYLAKVLELERAVLATLIDDQPRVVTFASNPLSLLRALAEGHLSEEAGQPGDFEIEITPDRPLDASGVGLESGQQVFPFH
ncbi:MAG: DUF692 family multinuclear iron-containing protein [Ktedonobacteraceae bacterium]